MSTLRSDQSGYKPWEAFGRDNPAGAMLYNIYHKRDTPQAVYHGSSARPSLRDKPRPEFGVGDKKSPEKPHVDVPKVGLSKRGPRPAPIEYIERRKSYKQIEAENAFEPEQFRPTAPKFRGGAKEKAKLQTKMGGTGAAKDAPKRVIRSRAEANDDFKFTTEYRKQELLQEIEERQRFIADMRTLGASQKHEASIRREIQQKLSELESL